MASLSLHLILSLGRLQVATLDLVFFKDTWPDVKKSHVGTLQNVLKTHTTLMRSFGCSAGLTLLSASTTVSESPSLFTKMYSFSHKKQCYDHLLPLSHYPQRTIVFIGV